MADQIRDWLTARYPSTQAQSPIEALFFAALHFSRGALPQVDKVDWTQQERIGAYKADFCFKVTGPDEKPRRLVVELDGHDFHERTKEQAAHDKRRDRFMLAQDVEVMRYTGSEIWANPFACVHEVYSRLYTLRYGVEEKKARARAYLEDLRKFFADDAA